jgi:hypothetical protein
MRYSLRVFASASDPKPQPAGEYILSGEDGWTGRTQLLDAIEELKLKPGCVPIVTEPEEALTLFYAVMCCEDFDAIFTNLDLAEDWLERRMCRAKSRRSTGHQEGPRVYFGIRLLPAQDYPAWRDVPPSSVWDWLKKPGV